MPKSGSHGQATHGASGGMSIPTPTCENRSSTRESTQRSAGGFRLRASAQVHRFSAPTGLEFVTPERYRWQFGRKAGPGGYRPDLEVVPPPAPRHHLGRLRPRGHPAAPPRDHRHPAETHSSRAMTQYGTYGRNGLLTPQSYPPAGKKQTRRHTEHRSDNTRIPNPGVAPVRPRLGLMRV